MTAAPLTNTDFDDEFRKVGPDSTATFDNSSANPTEHASSENLDLAPKDDLDEDEEVDEDDEEDDDDDLDEEDDDLEDDDDDDDEEVEDDLDDDDDEEDDEEEEEGA